MYLIRGLRVRRIDEAEDLALPLVDPVAEVADSVLLLGLQVELVGVGDVAGFHTAIDCVAIHEQGHWDLLSGPTVRPCGRWPHRSTCPCRPGTDTYVLRSRVGATHHRSAHPTIR